MRFTLRAGAPRVVAAMALVGALVAPAVPASAATDEPLVLRAGTDQDLQVLNPFNSVVVADFEVFTLNYDLLVGFDQEIDPAPGFAESWASVRRPEDLDVQDPTGDAVVRRRARHGGGRRLHLRARSSTRSTRKPAASARATSTPT